ncbi:MAG: penicillin-binding transpeptidase domain-containing protein [Actinomycetota bacterium]|nr:penicillin-binding transpeptidase domain-containing protein [Actinomycetota bacterium]
MFAPIYRLYVLVVGLFAVLVFATSWWTVFGAESLRDNTANRRPLLEQARIKRGLIKAADGTVLARSVKRSDDTYTRRYPQGTLLSHVIGYSFLRYGQAGLERSRNEALTGERDELTSIFDQLAGEREVGDDVVTTLDADAQRAAIDALGGQKGAVVALDPHSGAVKVMASYPQFDPNDIPQTLGRLNRDPDSPLLNRATQGRYAPGSTFKVVTAAAALDSGRYSPDSTVDGSSPKEISGVPLFNAGGANFGSVTLTQALTQSVNTVWAQVGEDLGKRTMARYMERFGFYRRPPLDYPPGQRFASGEFFEGDLLSPTSDRIDVGRMAIGQDKLQVTPLQMAMVAAAVANGGTLVRPHLTDRIVDPDGRVRDDVERSVYARVMKRETAEQLRGMMSNVVREGTGTAAALSGIEVAGKTGTAERGDGTNQVWFIALAPVDDPQIAIAVTVERTSGQGGTVAAPIARQVLEKLLGSQ